MWRECNPDTLRYTWRKPTPLKQSRLDFFLISDYVYSYLDHTDIIPGYRTDHSLITLTLKFGTDEQESRPEMAHRSWLDVKHQFKKNPQKTKHQL